MKFEIIEKEMIRVLNLYGRPMSINEIAENTGIDWATAKKYLNQSKKIKKTHRYFYTKLKGEIVEIIKMPLIADTTHKKKERIRVHIPKRFCRVLDLDNKYKEYEIKWKLHKGNIKGEIIKK